MKLNAPGVMQGFLNAEKDITAEDERKKNDAYKMQEMQAREQAMNYQAYQQGQQQLADKQNVVNNDIASFAATLNPMDPKYDKLFQSGQQASGPPPVTANSAPPQQAPTQQGGGMPPQQAPTQQGGGMPPPGAAPAPAPGQASQPIPRYNTVPGMAQANQTPPSQPQQQRMAPPSPPSAPPQGQPQQGGGLPPPGASPRPGPTDPQQRANAIIAAYGQSKNYDQPAVAAALGSKPYQETLKTRREDAKFALDTRKQNFEEAEKKTADDIAERRETREKAAQKSTETNQAGELKVSQGNLAVNQGRLAEEKKKNAASNAPVDPALIQSLGAQLRAGAPLSSLIRGRGAGSETQARQIQAEALKQEMEATGLPADKAGLSLANNQISQFAGKKSIGQLTTMQGSTKQAVDQLKYNIGQVQDDFKKLPSSDLSPVINAIARGEQKWTGDPAFSSLFFHMHATAMESARILAGGTASIAQLAPEAAKVAQGWANTGMTPRAFNEGSAPAMLGEGDNRLQTFGDAIKYQKLGGEGQKASSGLSSETKAPPVAEAYLKAHPEAKADFKAKYGYLP